MVKRYAMPLAIVSPRWFIWIDGPEGPQTFHAPKCFAIWLFWLVSLCQLPAKNNLWLSKAELLSTSSHAGQTLIPRNCLHFHQPGQISRPNSLPLLSNPQKIWLQSNGVNVCIPIPWSLPGVRVAKGEAPIHHMLCTQRQPYEPS
jgi:hypothetical protein